MLRAQASPPGGAPPGLPEQGRGASDGTEAAHGRTGHRPRSQEERPRGSWSKEEARQMAQLSEETLLS